MTLIDKFDKDKYFPEPSSVVYMIPSYNPYFIPS